MVLVNEYIIYGALRSSTNQFYGGTGTSWSTVNSAMTLPLLRRVATGLVGNHAMPVTKMLKPTAMYGTTAVFDAFNVYVPYQLEGDCRDLPNLTPVEQYSDPRPGWPTKSANCQALPLHHPPGHRGHPGQRASVASTGGQFTSTSGFEHRRVPADRGGRRRLLADRLRGEDSTKPVLMLPETSKTDPQVAPATGASWWKAVMVGEPRLDGCAERRHYVCSSKAAMLEHHQRRQMIGLDSPADRGLSVPVLCALATGSQ